MNIVDRIAESLWSILNALYGPGRALFWVFLYVFSIYLIWVYL
jgi:hypothetical protein